MKSKKYIFILVLLAILTFSTKVFANTSSSEYTIKNYDINMIVNEDNTFEITEKITAYFNVPKHGIYRKIPLRNSIIRNDGTKSNNIAKISNISVSENYKLYKEIGYQVIKIGNNDDTFTGTHSYTIKYTYNIGKDPLKEIDEFYFNLIGNEWDTSINNVSFKITMPKSFDKSLLGFSSGDTGSTDSSNISYSVDGNIITGSIKNSLSAGQALTVRLTLPEGYFVGASVIIDTYSSIVIVICVATVLIAFGLWCITKQKRKKFESIEYYPPEGYNSAEVGLLYNGEADTKGILSLLVYLANKGYLKIEEVETNEQGFKVIKLKEYDGKNKKNINDFITYLTKEDFIEKSDFNYMKSSSPHITNLSDDGYIAIEKATKKEFKFTKIKQYDGNNECEKLFLNGLFKNTSSVMESDLYNKFYKTIDKIKEKLNLNKSKFGLSAKWMIIMAKIIWGLILCRTLLECVDIDNAIESVIAIIILGILPFTVFAASFKLLISQNSNKKLIGIIVWILGSSWYITYAWPIITQNIICLLMHIIGIICIILLTFFIQPKRTQSESEAFEKIRGFKKYLETAEKSKLESLVEKNPEYFYDILPYTYALGISDLWINKFETIALNFLDCNGSKGIFHSHSFIMFMKRIAKYAVSESSNNNGNTFSHSHSHSSSGSSGGGSSGGGSGGGGGSSW